MSSMTTSMFDMDDPWKQIDQIVQETLPKNTKIGH